MTFELIKDFSGLEFFGNIPDTPNEVDERVEVFQLEESDWDILDKDFVDPINNLCNTLLDYGDVDFFNKEQCSLLKSWLVDKLQQNLPARDKLLYSKLLDFADQAIMMGTGIVIEL